MSMFDGNIGPWLTLCSIIFGAVTIWNGYRYTSLNALNQQVTYLRTEVDRLKKHTEECEERLNELRDTNEWLVEKLRERGELK